MSKDYFKLDTDAPLFRYFRKENNIEWWQKILNDAELYVNIRKNNRINVYFRGASVMELSWTKGNKARARIHKAYISLKNGRLGSDDYFKTYQPEEIVTRIDEIKQNIINYKQPNNPEGASEKTIQGLMYVKGRYIDTEFEFVREVPNRLITRIDFTTITREGLIEFVELKRISDNRLLKKDSNLKKEEIRTQIRDYNAFIAKHKEDIVNYYKQIQIIMQNIGVRNPLCNVNITGVSPDTRLHFAGYADGKALHPKRINRVAAIKQIMIEEHIKSNIDEI